MKTLALAVMLAACLPASAQTPNIAPVYEGFETNDDGSFNLLFGYYNRNWEEEINVPVGPDNRLEPGGPDQGQPAHFFPRRNQFVFRVHVPADFGDNEVNWTISFRGDTQTIPGHLHRDWMLDALGGGAGGDTPPIVRFTENGPKHRGPGNAPEEPLTATGGVTSVEAEQPSCKSQYCQHEHRPDHLFATSHR